MRFVKFASSAIIFTLAFTASATPSGAKGKPGGNEEPTIEVPTTVYIASSRKGPPSLVVAGADGSATQSIYNFANYAAYLHDAVLVSEGHGRALITDRAANPLPLIAVDFWFDSSGVVTDSQSRFLVDRLDWGCETLSSDGSRAIYAPHNSGTIMEIDIDSGAPTPIWTFESAQSFTSCDYQSENDLNGVIHAIVVDDGRYRIDKIDLAADSVTTLVDASPTELREVAAFYSNGTLVLAAISEPNSIRIGSSFGAAAQNDPSIVAGTSPDFYCDGGSMILRGQSKNRRVLQVYDLNTGNLDNYGSGSATDAKTLC